MKKTKIGVKLFVSNKNLMYLTLKKMLNTCNSVKNKLAVNKCDILRFCVYFEE